MGCREPRIAYGRSIGSAKTAQRINPWAASFQGPDAPRHGGLLVALLFCSAPKQRDSMPPACGCLPVALEPDTA